MNERIEQLARQVEACYIPRYDMWQMDSETMKKLAELIVEECANELIKWKDEPFPYDPEFGASLIKSLFGVK
jgi:hypothetical protein